MKKNKFKVGDIVTGNKKSDNRYCVTTTDMYEGEVIGISPNGEIRIKVLKHKRGDDVGLEFNVSSEYFDLVKGSTKVEPKEVKFKEGDRVIVNGIEGRMYFENAKGKLIRIEEIGHPTHLVEFDDYINGHNGNGDGKDGYCWWVYPHMLQLEVETKIEDKDSKPTFKVGDRVTPTTDRHVGKLATIKGIDGVAILLEFDEYVGGHGGHGEWTGKKGYCLWFNKSKIKLADEETKVETKMENKEYEFKVGDMVVVNGVECGKTFNNHVGEILHISESGKFISIEFDEFISGHNGHLGKGKKGHCWNVASKLVELYEDSKIIIYRKGNKVIAKNTVTKKEACARCHKDDTFDFAIGAKLALERLTAKTKVVKQDSYEVGDKVKIIDKWVPGCNENREGEMDKYLGTVMTIRDIVRGKYYMVEDKGDHFDMGWCWNSKCIEGKVVDEVDAVDTTKPKLLEKFEEGKTYIFDVDTFHINYPGFNASWVDECDGEEVEVINPIDGKVGIYNVSPKWCKEVEKPKYYNGKVVCVDNTGNHRDLTIGKIYKAVDGYITDDMGDKRPYEMPPFRVIEDLNEITRAKFIEVVE